ncbi:MAG: hypothetical protein U5K56_14205 [Halioglobus sp.]|nr:hypothetical protein [Halioglobus sp.]
MYRKKLIGLSLAIAIVAPSLHAAEPPPFPIDGLHIDLTFTEALAWATARGGECGTRQSRTQVGGIRADCNFATCEEPTPAGSCPETDPDDKAGNQLVRQISWVGFEAPAESAPLGRAVIKFEDSPDTVAQALVDAFGTPVTDTTDAEKSWSHSTRMGWRAANRTMGLLSAEHMIILTVDRPPSEPTSP